LVILYYVELSKDEALDLALNNNIVIVKIILDNEYEESHYEKTSRMMESSSLNLGDLQGEEFFVDSDNEEVKADWILPIIQKDMIYKKSILQLKSKYVCEMTEEIVEIKDCEHAVGKVKLIHWENILNITKIESTGTCILEVSMFKSPHYNIMGKILIFMLCSVILGISSLLIKLSQGLRRICVMD